MTKVTVKAYSRRGKKPKVFHGILEQQGVVECSHSALKDRILKYAAAEGPRFKAVAARYAFASVGPLVGKRKKGWAMWSGRSNVESIDEPVAEAKQSA